MNRTYQFRCRPTKAQTAWVDNALALVRDIYNIALEDRNKFFMKATGKKPLPLTGKQLLAQAARKEFLAANPEYAKRLKRITSIFRAAWKAVESEKTSLGFYDQDKCLKHIRAEFPEYRAFSFNVCREALRDLDNAFQAFFRRYKAGEKPGFPCFRSKRKPRQSIKFGGAARFCRNGELGYVETKGMPGELCFKIHNPAFLLDGVSIKTTTITRDYKGLLISFSCEIPDVIPTKTNQSVGVDVGIEKFLVTDDNLYVANPQLLYNQLKELRRKQRALSRKQPGSGNRERARKEVERLHAKVANTRQTFHREVAAWLVKKAAMEKKGVAVEDLDIKQLVEKKLFGVGNARQESKLRRLILDAGWGGFFGCLENKSESFGVSYEKVDPAYTSQACSGCGALVKKGLSVRIHKCPDCGLEIDRDLNAAINIRNRADSPTHVKGKGNARKKVSKNRKAQRRAFGYQPVGH